MMMGLKEYAGAIEFFKRSQELCGQHHVTWHNMGICYYYQDALEEAEKCFKESLALKPSYGEAHSWMNQVREKLGTAQGGGNGVMVAHDGGAVGVPVSGGVHEEEEEDTDGDDDEEEDVDDGNASEDSDASHGRR